MVVKKSSGLCSSDEIYHDHSVVSCAYLHGTLLCCAVQCIISKCSAVQYSTVQYSTVQLRTAQYSYVQHRT